MKAICCFLKFWLLDLAGFFYACGCLVCMYVFESYMHIFALFASEEEARKRVLYSPSN